MDNKIWNDQLEFNKKFFNDMSLDVSNLSVEDKIKWSKEFILHVEQELHDLIDCLPHWKMHYKNNEHDKTLIKSNMKEEYIDALKYMMGLGHVLDISYKDVVNVYEAKTEVVKQKYEQNRQIENLRNEEVVVFDIDGVINNYPDCFVDWVNINKKTSFKSLGNIKCQMNIEEYEKTKEEYRLSGDKRFQPINVDTVETITKLKSLGYKIVLYTVRPVNTYKRIYSDTLQWLNTNNIRFDSIYWSDYSKEDFYKLGLKIKFVVDDTLSNVVLFSKEGIKTYLLDKDYNKSDKDEGYIRIQKVSDILKIEDERRSMS